MKKKTRISVTPSTELILDVNKRKKRLQNWDYRPLATALITATKEASPVSPFGNIWLPWFQGIRNTLGEKAEPLNLLANALWREDLELIQILQGAFPMGTGEFSTNDDESSFDQLSSLPGFKVTEDCFSTSGIGRGTAIISPSNSSWRISLGITETDKDCKMVTRLTFPGFEAANHLALSQLEDSLKKAYPKQVRSAIGSSAKWADIKNMPHMSAWIQTLNGPYCWLYLTDLQIILSSLSQKFSTFLNIMDEHLKMENAVDARHSLDLLRRYVTYRRDERYFDTVRTALENAFDNARIEAQRQNIDLGTGAYLAIGNPNYWYLPNNRIAAFAVDGLELLFTLEEKSGKPQLGIGFRMDPTHPKAKKRNTLAPYLLRLAAECSGFTLNATFIPTTP